MTAAAKKSARRIQQEDAYGCAIACLAMAAGMSYAAMREEVALYWANFHPLEKFGGLDHTDERIILHRLGFQLSSVRAHVQNGSLRDFIGAAQAIITVPSLNVRGLSHAIFWTGKVIHDPSPFRKYDTESGWLHARAAHVVSPLHKAELIGIEGGAP